MQIREYLLPISVAFSYALFLAVVTIARYFELSLFQMTGSLVTTTLLLGVTTLLFCGRAGFLASCGVEKLFSKTVSSKTLSVVILLLGAYFLVFGIYDEVPADIYQHLSYTLTAFDSIQQFGFGDGSQISVMPNRGPRDFYILVSWLALVTNLTQYEIYIPVSIVGVFLFVLGFLAAADRLYRAFQFSPASHQIAVIFGTVFVASQMGLSVFSFIRYYSFAPSIINFVLYFTGIIILLDLFEGSKHRWKSMMVLLVAIIASAEIHFQESMFILTAALLLILWKLVEGIIQSNVEHRNRRKICSTLLVALTLTLIAIYVWIRLGNPLPWYRHSEVLETSFQYIGRVFYLDPTYKFYQVLTTWGVLVYILTIICFKRLLSQPFLLLAMASPIFTLFNPLVIDMFMRLGKGITVWRFGFFVPIHFVGGVLVVLMLEQIKQNLVFRRIASLAALAMLFLLLFPSVGGIKTNAHSKLTLASVPRENSWQHWRDLVEFMRSYEIANPEIDRRVLSDPVTAYMLRAFSHFRGYNLKFIPSPYYYRYQFSFDSYDRFPLSKYAGKLIIVNNRNGGKSSASAIARHWHEDILRLTDYYTPELSYHLESNPDRFEQLWSADKISVYLIR